MSCPGSTECQGGECVNNCGKLPSESCDSGDECCSGLCVDGTCENSCGDDFLNKAGIACSDDSESYTTDGVCASDSTTYYCDENEVATPAWDDCFSPGSIAYDSSPFLCEGDISGDFSPNGVCALTSPSTASANSINCDGSEVCYDDGITKGDCSLCDAGDPCHFGSTAGGVDFSSGTHECDSSNNCVAVSACASLTSTCSMDSDCCETGINYCTDISDGEKICCKRGEKAVFKYNPSLGFNTWQCEEANSCYSPTDINKCTEILTINKLGFIADENCLMMDTKDACCSVFAYGEDTYLYKSLTILAD